MQSQPAVEALAVGYDRLAADLQLLFDNLGGRSVECPCNHLPFATRNPDTCQCAFG